APERTATSSGCSRSPNLRPPSASAADRASSTCLHIPGGKRPVRVNALQAFVVIVKPGGTGRPSRVISARPAPLPPRRSRMEAFPSSNAYTCFARPDPHRGSPELIYNNLRSRMDCSRCSVPPDGSEAHLVHFEVGPLSFEEPVHGLVFALTEQHEHRLSGDRHLERPADQGHRVAPHADLDAGELLD